MNKKFACCMTALGVVISSFLSSQDAVARKSAYPILRGNMVSNLAWSGLDNTEVPRGIYNLPLKPNLSASEITPVATHPFMNGLSGGTVSDNVYYAIVTHPMPGIPYSTTYFSTFGLDEGNLITDELISSALHIALGTTTDPSTGTVYGIFYGDEWQTTYEFGTIDYKTMTRGESKFAVTQPYVLAAAPEGVIYAIGYDDGYLYKVNVAAQSFDKIGDTGLGTLKFYENQWKWYAYPQSMIYDTRSNRLYWAEYRRTDWQTCEANLYEVNPENGSVTLMSEMPNLIEMTNLYIPWEPADAAPDDITNLRVDFSGGNKTGNICFTLPSTTYDGESLTGELTCYITANGDTISTVKAQSGSAVAAPVTISDDSSVYFKVSAANNAGSSNVAGIRAWIGRDYPLAVSDIALTFDKTTGTVNLTWAKVSSQKGVNDGYVDTDNITYTVTRYPDEVVVAENIAESACTDKLLKGNEMQSYYYTVIASNGTGFNSEATTSSRCIYGKPFDTPYFDDIDGTISQYLYTVHDNNADGESWITIPTSVATETRWEYNSSNAQGKSDEWLITPAITLSPDSLYRFSAAIGTTTRYTSKIEAAYGTDADDLSGYQTLVEPFEFNTPRVNQFITKDIRVDKAGEYYFGLHAINEGAGGIIVVDSIEVKSLGLIGAPGAVRDLTVNPDDTNINRATISFYSPDVSSTGEAINTLSYIEVYRDNSVLLATLKDVAVGKQYTVEDEVGEGGFHSYSAVAYNDRGKGLDCEPIRVWFGYDMPLAPENVLLKDNFDGTFTVTWNIPERGVHGGFVDPSVLKFNIYKVSATNYILDVLGSDVEGNSYTAGLPANSWKQDFMYVSVMATLDGLAVTDRTMSNCVQYGEPNTLPFVESAPNGQFQNNQTLSVCARDPYTGFFTNTGRSADEDGGSIMFTSYNTGAWARIGTGMISIAGSVDPRLSYSYYAIPGVSADLKVDVIKANGMDSTAVKTVNLGSITDTEQWCTSTISLQPWIDEHHIYVCFTGTVNDPGAQIYIDNIEVKDYADPTGINSAEAEKTVEVKVVADGLVITSATDIPVALYNISGAEVYSGNCKAGVATTVNVEKGMYVIVAGNVRKKIAVL